MTKGLAHYGIFTCPLTGIYDRRAVETPEHTSALADEGLAGHGVVIEGEEGDFYQIRTHYNYSGYVKKNEIHLVQDSQMKNWGETADAVVMSESADVLSLPGIRGLRIVRLCRGCLVRKLATEKEGWQCVELADGTVGYIRGQFLEKCQFSMAGLWKPDKLCQHTIVNEKKFRDGVIQNTLRYLGVQYTWGGKSSWGLDCSGLASMCYMLQGVLIFRDARIEPGFPVKEIPKENIKPGDLLYFPGHVAVYLGKGRYIHSTARLGSGGVVINSLREEDTDYREDLKTSFYAAGSIF